MRKGQPPGAMGRAVGAGSAVGVGERVYGLDRGGGEGGVAPGALLGEPVGEGGLAEPQPSSGPEPAACLRRYRLMLECLLRLGSDPLALGNTDAWARGLV